MITGRALSLRALGGAPSGGVRTVAVVEARTALRPFNRAHNAVRAIDERGTSLQSSPVHESGNVGCGRQGVPLGRRRYKALPMVPADALESIVPDFMARPV